MSHQEETVTPGWDWIIAVEDSPSVLTLLIQKLPRIELYLPKAKLDEEEYRALHGGLVAHGKLKRK